MMSRDQEPNEYESPPMLPTPGFVLDELGGIRTWHLTFGAPVDAATIDGVLSDASTDTTRFSADLSGGTDVTLTVRSIGVHPAADPPMVATRWALGSIDEASGSLVAIEGTPVEEWRERSYLWYRGTSRAPDDAGA